jgi:hypothetical protein
MTEPTIRRRGISQQQRRILGMAYAFNVLLNDGVYRSPGAPIRNADLKHPRKRLPDEALLSWSTSPPDIFPWMLEHYVGGCEFEPPQPYPWALWEGYQQRLSPWAGQWRRSAYRKTAQFNNRKASLRRANETLRKHGLLAIHFWMQSALLAEQQSDSYEYECGWGYVLTPRAVEIGAANAYDLGDAVTQVTEILVTTGRWTTASWFARTPEAERYREEERAKRREFEKRERERVTQGNNVTLGNSSLVRQLIESIYGETEPTDESVTSVDNIHIGNDCSDAPESEL